MYRIFELKAQAQEGGGDNGGGGRGRRMFKSPLRRRKGSKTRNDDDNDHSTISTKDRDFPKKKKKFEGAGVARPPPAPDGVASESTDGPPESSFATPLGLSSTVKAGNVSADDADEGREGPAPSPAPSDDQGAFLTRPDNAAPDASGRFGHAAKVPAVAGGESGSAAPSSRSGRKRSPKAIPRGDSSSAAPSAHSSKQSSQKRSQKHAMPPPGLRISEKRTAEEGGNVGLMTTEDVTQNAQKRERNSVWREKKREKARKAREEEEEEDQGSRRSGKPRMQRQPTGWPLDPPSAAAQQKDRQGQDQQGQPQQHKEQEQDEQEDKHPQEERQDRQGDEQKPERQFKVEHLRQERQALQEQLDQLERDERDMMEKDRRAQDREGHRQEDQEQDELKHEKRDVEPMLHVKSALKRGNHSDSSAASQAAVSKISKVSKGSKLSKVSKVSKQSKESKESSKHSKESSKGSSSTRAKAMTAAAAASLSTRRMGLDLSRRRSKSAPQERPLQRSLIDDESTLLSTDESAKDDPSAKVTFMVSDEEEESADSFVDAGSRDDDTPMSDPPAATSMWKCGDDDADGIITLLANFDGGDEATTAGDTITTRGDDDGTFATFDTYKTEDDTYLGEDDDDSRTKPVDPPGGSGWMNWWGSFGSAKQREEEGSLLPEGLISLDPSEEGSSLEESRGGDTATTPDTVEYEGRRYVPLGQEQRQAEDKGSDGRTAAAGRDEDDTDGGSTQVTEEVPTEKSRSILGRTGFRSWKKLGVVKARKGSDRSTSSSKDQEEEDGGDVVSAAAAAAIDGGVSREESLSRHSSIGTELAGNRSPDMAADNISVYGADERREKRVWDEAELNRDVYCSAHGGLQNLVVRMHSDVPTPNAPDHILVRVEASTVSTKDCVVRLKGEAGTPPDSAAVPGFYIVGTVHTLGTDAATFRLGDRVAALLPDGGGNSRYASVPVEDVILIPEDSTHPDTVCLVANYMPAYQCLKMARKDGAPLTNSNVLITGGSEPMGQALIELALREGAKVYATAHKMHEEHLTKLGARWFSTKPRKWLPFLEGKMDVVVDGLCVDGYESSYRALAPDGRLVCNTGCHTYLLQHLLHRQPTFCDAIDVNEIMTQLSMARAKYLWRRARLYDPIESYESNPKMFGLELQYLICKLNRGEINPKVAGRVCLNQVPKAQELIEKGLPNGTVICLPWKELDPKQKVTVLNI